MANYTSTHTGAVIDASVTKVSASGVTQADFTKLNAVTSSATELNLLDGVTSTTAEINILDGVTSTAAEINILDGATLSVTELNYLDGADSSITTLSLPDNTTITAFGASLIDDANASTARSTLNVDVAGTDNSTNVTLVTTSYDYLSLSGQAITLGQIDISDDTNLAGGDGLALTGDTLSVNVDDSSIEINSDTLRVKALGISNAMLGGSIANAKLSNSSVSYGGISLSLGGSDATPAFDLSDATSLPIIAGTTGTLTVARGGTGATTASGARTNLNVDVAGTDNSTDVTLVTTSHDYLSISGQAVTLGQVDISDDTNLVGGTGITLTGDTLSTTDSEIVHDDLSGFVSNEHIDHSSVSITAGTGLSGGGDITSTRTLTTDDSAIVHDDLSGFVANEHIDHSGVSITAGAGLTGGGDITATRDIAVGAGTGVTVNADDIAIGQDVGTNADVTFNSVIADNFIGSLDGAVKFEAKATVALNKGDAVYVVGVSGNTPTIALADANDATKMPSFGLVGSSASIDDVVEVVTFGTLKNINTSSFSEGDILFITSNGTAGNTLTATKEGGESVLCQNIGKVIRSHATVGSIKVGGAGRANATPNLNDGNIFIGNGSNQAVSASLNTKIEDYLDGGTSTANFDTISVDGAEITATPAELNVLDGITSTTAELNYTDGVTSNIQTQLDLKAPLASPAFTGTATGANLTLSGDLTVNGSTTTLDTTNLAVEDNLMELNAGVTSNANDSGFLIERGSTGDNAIFMWDESADKFTLGTTTATGTTTGDITLSSTGTLVANVEGGVTGAVTGNADTATTLATARNFSLTGDVTAGAVSFDGSGNVALSTTIAANSVALGTDTTGNYMSDLTEGTGIDISHTPAEGSNGTITLDLTEVGFGGGANRLITDDGDGTVSTEANLTFDGSHLSIAPTGRIYLDGGGNTYIYEELADQITFSAGGGNYFKISPTNGVVVNDPGADVNFRVESNNNQHMLFVDGGTDRVGIGTNSPTDTLQVEGSIGVGVGRDAQLTSVNNGLAIRNLVSNADMFFYVNDGGVDTEAMRIDGATANVGIGTTSPGAALEIKDYFQIEASSSYMGILGFNRNVNTGAILNGSYGAYQLHNYQGKLQLQVYNSSGTAVDQNALVVDNSANVGIGTTSPGANLDVAGSGGTDGAAGSPTLRLSNTVDSTDWDTGDVVGTLEYYAQDPSGNAPYVTSFIKSVNGVDGSNGTLPSGSLTFGVSAYNAVGGAVERMRIESDGNVGIGTTTPQGKFQVRETSTNAAITSVNPAIVINNQGGSYTDGNYYSSIVFAKANSNGGTKGAAIAPVIQNSGNSTELSFSTIVSGGTLTEALRIDKNQNVGIGTTSPDSKLQVEYTTTSNGSAAIAEFGTSGSGAIANSGHQVIIGGPSVGGYTGAMIYSDSTSGVGQISFADGRGANDSWRGTIAYEHANDRMEFWTNATEKIAINSDGDFIPAGDGTQDLGASSKRWGVIYSADLDLSNEGSENDVDGTWGSYVIQEGEEDLFLINRRSGKKYKFMLQEVQD